MTPANLARTLCLIVLMLVLEPRPAHACAGCRNPSFASSRGSEGPLAAGGLRVGATVTGTTVHVVHEAGCTDVAMCSEVPVQPRYLHDQMLYPLELRFAVEYGISETFGVEAQLPFRLVQTTIEYTTPGGAAYQPLDAGVHHRDETVLGPSDPWLLLRIGTSFEKWWLAARPGVSLPLGRTEENPFELGDQGRRHQHIQLGTGSFGPVLVLEASTAFDDWSLSMFVQGQASVYENSHGYLAPWRVHGGAALGHKLVGDLSGSLGLESFHEAAERWNGEIRQDGSLGRTEVLGAAMLTQALGDTELSLTVRVPFYRDIVVGDEAPGTLSSPLVVGLGIMHVFGNDEPTPMKMGSAR